MHAFTPGTLAGHAGGAGLERVRVRGEELAASLFGWANRALEATAAPDEIPYAWRMYAYRGYLLLQALDRSLLEPRLPAAVFYNLLISGAAAPGLAGEHQRGRWRPAPASGTSSATHVERARARTRGRRLRLRARLAAPPSRARRPGTAAAGRARRAATTASARAPATRRRSEPSESSATAASGIDGHAAQLRQQRAGPPRAARRRPAAARSQVATSTSSAGAERAAQRLSSPSPPPSPNRSAPPASSGGEQRARWAPPSASGRDDGPGQREPRGHAPQQRPRGARQQQPEGHRGGERDGARVEAAAVRRALGRRIVDLRAASSGAVPASIASQPRSPRR